MIRNRTVTKTALNLTPLFSATTLSHASHFRQKWRVNENLEYLGEVEEYFRKCWLYCVLYILVTERCKKRFKNRLYKSCACVPLSWGLLLGRGHAGLTGHVHDIFVVLDGCIYALVVLVSSLVFLDQGRRMTFGSLSRTF
jgi:hypothetical protein